MVDLKTIAEIIKTKERFVVSAHMHADGDAAASQLGIARVLHQIGKEAIVVNDEETPLQFKFLPGVETILQEVPADYKPDTVIIIDTPIRRIINCGDIRKRFLDGKPAEESGEIGGTPWTDIETIFLDHHERSEHCGEHIYVDSKASASATIVGRLMHELDVEPDADIGTAIICGIMSDTGRFSFANTTSESLKLVAEVVDAGANVNNVATELFYRNEFASVWMTGQALSTLKLSESGKVCTMILKEEAVNDQGQPVEPEDLPTYPVTIRGVEIGLFLRPASDGGVRVSLRSAGNADVNRFASLFDGGGHKKAAGCRMPPGHIEDARDTLVAAAEKYLAENPDG
jgi:bifunctional oligoribonuclease and PAP phosphatase NrnA